MFEMFARFSRFFRLHTDGALLVYDGFAVFPSFAKPVIYSVISLTVIKCLRVVASFSPTMKPVINKESENTYFS